MSSPAFIEFVVVRHGETESNIGGTVQGQVDSPLNKLGLRQAAAAAEYLHAVHFDGCVTSDLRRAVDTARVILTAGGSSLEIQQTAEFREWSLGDLENRAVSELIQENPVLMRSFRYESGAPFEVPGGESSTAFLARVRGAMTRLSQEFQTGQRVLIVTHGAVINRILQVVTGLFQKGNRIPIVENASISVVRYFPSESAWELHSWNQCDHLKGLPTHENLKF